MTIILLSGGDLGLETMTVRCDLCRAECPVEVNYGEGEGWEPSQYQCADAGHVAGLISIAKKVAARAVEMPEAEFECAAEELRRPQGRKKSQ